MLDRIKLFIITYLPFTRSEQRARLMALDLIRGLFLVIIFADHLSYQPSLMFEAATHYSALIASAAEGFFVISGALIGYIYGPKMLKNPGDAAKKLWKRAAVLYLLTIVFTLLYTAWAYLLPNGYPRAIPYDGALFEIVFRTITLQYQYGWANFLGRYAVFVAFSPLVLWLITKRFAWLVAIVSYIIWLLYANVPILQFYTAWQFIFMISAIIGYYLPSIEATAKKLPKLTKEIGWWSIVLIGSTSYIASVLWIVVISPRLSVIWLAPQYMHYFDKNSLAIGRILVGVLWFTAIYLIVRRYEKQINSITKGVFLVFGQNSLFVYCLQAFIIFSVDVFMLAPEKSPVLVNTLVGLAGIYIVYVITKHKTQIKMRLWNGFNYLLKSKE